jgi:hypothetical protein
VAVGSAGVTGPGNFSVHQATNVNLIVQTGTLDTSAVMLTACNDAYTAVTPLTFRGSYVNFITNGGTEVARFDAFGNFGLGVTPSTWGSNYRALQVGYGGSVSAGNGTFPSYVSMGANYYIDSASATRYLQTSASSIYSQNGGVHAWYTAPSGTAGTIATFTQAMTLGTDGSLTVAKTYAASGMSSGSGSNVVINLSNGSFFYATSALKYKQDVRDLESIDINKFRPVRYKSKCESDDQTIDYFGVIADEVHEAGITELVNYKDGEVEGFQYERLTVVLLKVLQEQQVLITQLQADVAAIKH